MWSCRRRFRSLLLCLSSVERYQLPCLLLTIKLVGGDVAKLVEHRTGTLPTQVRFPGAARDFSPSVNLQCRLSYGVRKAACAIACIYICAHVKDHVVHVRVRWIVETLKHPACTVGWTTRLCRSWLSPGKATRIFYGRNSTGTIQLLKKKYLKKQQQHSFTCSQPCWLCQGETQVI